MQEPRYFCSLCLAVITSARDLETKVLKPDGRAFSVICREGHRYFVDIKEIEKWNRTHIHMCDSCLHALDTLLVDEFIDDAGLPGATRRGVPDA